MDRVLVAFGHTLDECIPVFVLLVRHNRPHALLELGDIHLDLRELLFRSLLLLVGLALFVPEFLEVALLFLELFEFLRLYFEFSGEYVFWIVERVCAADCCGSI